MLVQRIHSGPDFFEQHEQLLCAVSLGIPAAVVVIKRGIEDREAIRDAAIAMKRFLVLHLTPQEGEGRIETIKRILGNVRRGVSISLIAGAVVGGIIGIKMLINKFDLIQFSDTRLVYWFKYDFQIPCYVLSGYALIGNLHTFRATRHFPTHKLIVIKHIFATCVTILTIYMMARNLFPTRWHHLSYSLLALLPELIALNTFGFIFALDDLSYMPYPNRNPYDFSSILDQNRVWYITILALCTLIECLPHKKTRNVGYEEIPLEEV